MQTSPSDRGSCLQRTTLLLVSRAAAPYWILLGLALAVRIADQYFMSTYAPTYGQLWPDSHVYDRWAREIAQTFWLGWDRIPFHHGPLYPYVLGMLYLRFSPGIATAAWSQRLLGALTVLMIFWLARRIFGKRAGWFAGIGAACCPLFLMYESEILVETLVLFLHVGTLCLFVLAFERKTRGLWIASGIGMGLCCLGRPNALLFLPFMMFWVFLITRKGAEHCAAVRDARLDDPPLPENVEDGKNPGNLGFFSRCMPAILMGVATILVISPATVLNYVVGGHFHLISATGSYNTYIGNAPDTLGIFASTPSTIAIRELEGKPDEAINWRHYLLDALREEPFSLPRNLWKKTCLFWQSGEIPSGPNYYLQRAFSPFLALPFRWAVIAPLGIVGILLAFLKNRPNRLDDPRLLLLIWLLLYTISIVLIFVMGRLRLPAMAILLLFAGYALSCCLDTVLSVVYGQASPKRLWLVLLVLCLWPVLGMALKTRDTDMLIGWNDYFNLGRAFEAKRQLEEALVQYEHALRLAPGTEIIETLREDVLERLHRIH